MKEGRTNIVFNCPSESLYIASVLKIHAVIDQLTDYQINLFHVTGTLTSSAYQDMATLLGYTGRAPTILPTISQLAGFCAGLRSPEWMTLLTVPYKKEIKLKKFVCFNRIHKGHRAYILAKFLESGLVNDSFFSFEGAYPTWTDRLHIYDWAPVIREQFTKHLNIFPLRLNITAERNNPVRLDADDLQYHLNSYFSLVNETIFFKDGSNRAQQGAAWPGVFITEKMARPLLLKHPFIATGSHGYLSALRSLGFQTFHPFIDESYDSEEDDDKRLDMIVAETERLCKFTDDQWIQWQHDVADIVEHNFTAILNSHPHNIPNVLAYFKN